jgi:hypothetical protein
MKTTVELTDQLAAEARRIARARGLTLRELIERGLRAELRRLEAPSSYHWEPLVGGRPTDPFPTRPPHELAYEGDVGYDDPPHP